MPQHIKSCLSLQVSASTICINSHNIHTQLTALALRQPHDISQTNHIPHELHRSLRQPDKVVYKKTLSVRFHASFIKIAGLILLGFSNQSRESDVVQLTVLAFVLRLASIHHGNDLIIETLQYRK